MRLLTSLTFCSAFLFASSTYLFAAEDVVKIDNNVVRIEEVAYVPRASRPVPRPEVNRVLVSLGDGNIQLTGADGHKSRVRLKTGQALWMPAGQTVSDENVGAVPLQTIEMELKNPAPASAVARNPKLDPIVIDPKHNVLLLENAQVRVFRSWREPGASEKMHEHTGAGRAAILLTDIDATVKVVDGGVTPLRASSGDVLWSGIVTHATTNLGPKKFDMIVVEVK